MIEFNTINCEGIEKHWEFNSVKELEDEWKGKCDLPANDDVLVSVDIDGETKEIPKGAYFEDLLTMVGIEIW